MHYYNSNKLCLNRLKHPNEKEKCLWTAWIFSEMEEKWKLKWLTSIQGEIQTHQQIKHNLCKLKSLKTSTFAIVWMSVSCQNSYVEILSPRRDGRKWGLWEAICEGREWSWKGLVLFYKNK